MLGRAGFGNRNDITTADGPGERDSSCRAPMLQRRYVQARGSRGSRRHNHCADRRERRAKRHPKSIEFAPVQQLLVHPSLSDCYHYANCSQQTASITIRPCTGIRKLRVRATMILSETFACSRNQIAPEPACRSCKRCPGSEIWDYWRRPAIHTVRPVFEVSAKVS